jgi:hypothetical protein
MLKPSALSVLRYRVLPTLAVTAAVALIPSTAAAAGSLSVVPSTAHEGQNITVTVKGCAAKAATATSPAFANKIKLTSKNGELSGTGRIAKDAKAGNYSVQSTCSVDKSTLKGTVTVTR